MILIKWYMTYGSEEVMICGVDPLCGPACRAREPGAGVAVMVETVPPAPEVPDVFMEKVLVWALLVRAGVQPGVGQHLVPGELPVVSPLLSVQLGSPASAHDRDGVPGMISHGVEAPVWLQPLHHSRCLPLREPAVQVPGHHHRHLRVQGGQEPPQHREEVGRLPGCHWPGDRLDITEVQQVSLTGQPAQSGHEGVVWSRVVVQPYYEAWQRKIVSI